MSLDRYKMPDAVKDGSEYALKDAPEVKFVAKLPTTFNKAYRREMMAGMRVTEKGEVDMDLFEVHEVNHQAFLKTCVVSVAIDGKPVDDVDAFLEEYPLAAEELADWATKEAKKLEVVTQKQVKKPKLVSNG